MVLRTRTRNHSSGLNGLNIKGIVHGFHARSGIIRWNCILFPRILPSLQIKQTQLRVPELKQRAKSSYEPWTLPRTPASPFLCEKKAGIDTIAPSETVHGKSFLGSEASCLSCKTACFIADSFVGNSTLGVERWRSDFVCTLSHDKPWVWSVRDPN